MNDHPGGLPEPRRQGHYEVAVVCLGNICRSPIAEVVLRDRLDATGLSDRVGVRSAGTGGWHIGKGMDPRAAAVLDQRGYDPSRHRARQVDQTWLGRMDLVLAMDHDNLSTVRDHRGMDPHRIRLFRSVGPQADRGLAVPDPYHGQATDFEAVLAVVEVTAEAWTAELRTLLG